MYRIKTRQLAITVSLTVFIIISKANGCTFPRGLAGVWESPSKGNITFNPTYMTGYDVDTHTGMEFECYLTHTAWGKTYYVLRSGNFTVLGGNVVNAALCLTFTQVSTYKYTYFVVTSELPDANYERAYYVYWSTAVTTSDICNDLGVADVPQETKLLIQPGYQMSEAVQCPDAILGQYWYYNDTSCNESSWDGCTTLTQMTFNYTQCSTKQAFSADGLVYCVYNVANGTSMVTYVYNNDSSVDNSATYQYTCMVIEVDSSTGIVYVTQNPRECYYNQSSTVVPAGGTTMMLAPNTTCVPSNTTATESPVASASGLVAGMVVLVLLLVAGGAVGGYFLYVKKFKQVNPNGRPPSDTTLNKKEPTSISTSTMGDARSHAVTPSVIDTQFTSPRDPYFLANGNTHGNQKINVVNTPPCSTPIVSAKASNGTESRRRIKRSTKNNKMKAKPISSRRDSTYQNVNSLRHKKDYGVAITQPSILPRQVHQDDNMPLFPPINRLPPVTHSGTPVQSRQNTASTLFAEAISINVLSARTERRDINCDNECKSKPPIPYTEIETTRLSSKGGAKRIDTSRKTNAGRRNHSKHAQMSIQSLRTSMHTRTYPHIIRKQRNHSCVHKKKFVLTGKTPRYRNQSQSKVTEGQSEGNSVRKTTLSEKAANQAEKSKTADSENKLHVTDIDDNFFMCSDVTNDTYTEYSKELKLSSKNHIDNPFDMPQSPVPQSKPPQMHAYVEPTVQFTRVKTFDARIMERAEQVAKSLTHRTTKKRQQATTLHARGTPKQLNKSTCVVYKSKRTRRRKLVNLTTLKNFERMPTLINWVDCTDMLRTTAMKSLCKRVDDVNPFTTK